MDRVNEVLEGLHEEFKEFKQKVDEEYIRSENFEELFEETMTRVGRERSAEKRTIYRDFLAGAIKSPEHQYDQQLRFIQTLEALQADDVRVLRPIMQTGTSPPQNIGAGSPRATLKRRIPELEEARITEAVQRLEDLRLVGGMAPLGSSMTPQGAEELDRWITLPMAPVSRGFSDPPAPLAVFNSPV